MEVKSGYKQTEVGVIPEEWRVIELAETARVVDSLHQTPSFAEDGYPMIRVTDIKPGNLSFVGTLMVTDAVFAEFTKNYKPKRGDIVLSRVGSYGVSSFVETDEPFCMGQNTVVLQPKLPPRFLYYVLNSRSIGQQIEDGSYGSGYKSLSLKNIKELRIPVPPTDAEQHAIAEALSDVDGLLGGLDRLITKKRDLKQAAMQQLLTGQTRLPGFHGEWEVKTFATALIRLNAKAHQIQTSDYESSGRYPVVDQGKEVVIGYSDKEEKRFQCPEGGVIVFGDHTCIVKFIDFDFLVGADGTQVLQARTGQSTRFHALHLQYRGVQPTGYNRHFKFLKEREFVSPPLPEQTAIAEVLSDMDAELAALEQRRDKTRALKQAMMQELLTGRTRLVSPDAGTKTQVQR